MGAGNDEDFSVPVTFVLGNQHHVQFRAAHDIPVGQGHLGAVIRGRKIELRDDHRVAIHTGRGISYQFVRKAVKITGVRIHHPVRRAFSYFFHRGVRDDGLDEFAPVFAVGTGNPIDQHAPFFVPEPLGNIEQRKFIAFPGEMFSETARVGVQRGMGSQGQRECPQLLVGNQVRDRYLLIRRDGEHLVTVHRQALRHRHRRQPVPQLITPLGKGLRCFRILRRNRWNVRIGDGRQWLRHRFRRASRRQCQESQQNLYRNGSHSLLLVPLRLVLSPGRGSKRTVPSTTLSYILMPTLTLRTLESLRVSTDSTRRKSMQ